MPPPVIANVFKVAHRIEQDLGLGYTIFTRHYRAPGLDVADIAAAYIDHFSGDQVLVLSSNWAFQSMEITPLDGLTAPSFFAFTGGAHGTASGDIVPGYCNVISQRTAVRGPRGRGRMYIGPTTEGALTSGRFLTANLTTIAASWGAFDANMAGDGIQPVVASYVHSDAHDVVSIRADQSAGIQRRRQRRIAP